MTSKSHLFDWLKCVEATQKESRKTNFDKRRKKKVTLQSVAIKLKFSKYSATLKEQFCLNSISEGVILP